MTCRPAPIANRSSVAVGDNEMIRLGRCLIVTLPLAAVTVTGNAWPGAAASVLLAPAQAAARVAAAINAASSATASCSLTMKKPPRFAEEEARRPAPHNPPFLRGLR